MEQMSKLTIGDSTYEVVDAQARKDLGELEIPTKVSDLDNDAGYLTDHQDLSEYAKKTEVPSKTSQLINTSGFLTEIPSEYVTETELQSKGYLTEVPSEYVTETELDGKGFLTAHQDLSGYAKTSDIPTKVSQLTNDAGYLKSIPSEYVTETELTAKGYLTEHQDLTDYAKKTDLPSVPTKTSQLTNDSGFLTSIPGEYVTETELAAKKYLTSIPTEYVTDTELTAKGYAKQTDVTNLSKEIDDLKENGSGATEEQIQQIEKNKQDISAINNRLETGNFNGLSAYQVACNNGFVGTETEWIASLSASNPKVLTKVQYPTEAEAIAYMEEQGNDNAVYVWNNKVYCSAEIEVTGSTGLTGVCLRGYRNSASSGIKLLEGASLFIFPVSTFTVPVTIDFSPYGLATSPYIYGGTTPTAFPTTVYDNEAVVATGAKGPVTVTDLKGCTYLAFAIGSQPNGATIKVNGTEINLTLITSTSEIESAMSGGSSGSTETIKTFVDSGITFTEIVGQNSCQQYLDARNTYIAPVPSGYCESKVEYNTVGTHYLNKYNFTTMTGMFTALATANPDYVTETLLGKDSTNTYEIKSYVLDAPSAISSGYESAMGRDKPTFIITAGLHGVEPDAVHSVYHFMKDLCENYMENDHLEYLRNNVKFVIVPLANPWGYVNQSYHNANDVDLNKNFAHGYRTNGTANTGANAYSEVETTLLKGVFDSYPKAIFHLECHGKYGEDTSIAQTIWFSLMRSLNSDLIEICAETITKQIGRRTYKLGHNANKSVGGYITYYGMNGRPKDYTGTEYGMLSCTMEGSGKLYGTTGYAIDTQKVNTEALENFILRVLDALNSRVEVF